MSAADDDVTAAHRGARGPMLRDAFDAPRHRTSDVMIEDYATIEWAGPDTMEMSLSLKHAASNDVIKNSLMFSRRTADEPSRETLERFAKELCRSVIDVFGAAASEEPWRLMCPACLRKWRGRTDAAALPRCHHAFTVVFDGETHTAHCMYEDGHNGDCLTRAYGYRKVHSRPIWSSEDSDWPGWVGPRGETWPPPTMDDGD